MNEVIDVTPKNLGIDPTQVPSMVGIITPISKTQVIFTPISNNVFLENSRGVFGNSIRTYNEAEITYNEAGEVYAGGDILAGAIPNMLSIGILDTTTLKVLVAGQPMGLLLTLTYSTAGTIS